MKDVLRVQINNYDSYQIEPTRLDQNYGVCVQVPIIRIYGSIGFGKKSYNILVHVHNTFPYLYIDCQEADLSIRSHEDKFINDLLERKIEYLETLLLESFKHDKGTDEDPSIEDPFVEETAVNEANLNDSNSKRKYIADVTVCRGTPIYGYHVGYRLVYKVSLLSPLYKARLIKLIHDKKVAMTSTINPKKPSQCNIYEAHLPYTLQFLTDFNLYGCGWLDIGQFYFRTPITTSSGNNTQLIDYIKEFIQRDNVLSNSFKRIGKSTLEIDIRANEILNRNNLQERHLHDDFTELSSFKSGEFKKQIYLSSLIHTSEDLKYQCEVRNKSLPSTQNILNGFLGMGLTNWPNQDELDELLKYAIAINKASVKDKREPIKSKSFPTIFQSIEIECRKERQHVLDIRTDIFHWKDGSELFSRPLMDNNTQSFSIFSPLLYPNPNKSNDIKESNDIDNIISDNDQMVDDIHDNDQMEDDMPDINSSQNDDVKEIETSEEIRKNLSNDNAVGVDDRFMLSLTQNKKRKYADSSYSNLTHSLQIPSSFEQLNHNVQDNVDLSLWNIRGKNVFNIIPPDEIQKTEILNLLEDLGIVKIDYNDPYFSDSKDVPRFPLIYSNKKIIVPCMNSETILKMEASNKIKDSLCLVLPRDWVPNKSSWVYVKSPPSKRMVTEWVQNEELVVSNKAKRFKSQIELPITKSNDFKYSINSSNEHKKSNDFNNLTNFCMEIHCNTTGTNLPDPESDSISAIFYNFDNANEMDYSYSNCGVLILEMKYEVNESISHLLNFLPKGSSITQFEDEFKMVESLILILEHFDPDILSGYEINSSSWGYLIERFRTKYEINLLPSLSRCNFKNNGKFGDRWGYTHTSAIEVTGRHCLNIWRTLRSDLNLTDYSLENVSYHVLHRELPKYKNSQLSLWFMSDDFNEICYFFSYYFKRIFTIEEVVNLREIISKNIEQSRLIGIDFNSNFYRGSQFKVESILSRLSKAENLLLNSPSKQEVHLMKPLECIPLVMEPDSNFYKSPLVVLDFQSLYPSIIIGYNYCFSTMLGRLKSFKSKKNTVGYIKNLPLDSGILEYFQQNNAINTSPNGLMFVKSCVRKSILAKMLEDILNMRFRIKYAMSEFKEDTKFNKVYNSKQLALKLIANVTYGYASATFSGRMPNSDLADAIVATGREILCKSIDLIENGDYGAKVVYGDTDSLFVYFPGKSREEAFKLGRQISKFITDQFPDPICLNFEKVYHPCVLLSKKRYVGNCYTSESQTSAIFDAKGIETIRRDGIPAQQKIVGKALRILFNSQDLSKVKEYVQNEFQKIILDKIAINDFCFAKEVRYGTYKNEAHLPPGAIVARRNMDKDARAEPQYRERVPYVVIFDKTKPRIKDRCISPEEYMQSYFTSKPLALDYEYYITRMLIPPLDRIFKLVGIETRLWYQQIQNSPKQFLSDSDSIMNYSKLIERRSCLYCGKELALVETGTHLCTTCFSNKGAILADNIFSLKERELQLMNCIAKCHSCVPRNMKSPGGRGIVLKAAESCQNLSCNIFYNKFKSKTKYEQLKKVSDNLFNSLQW